MGTSKPRGADANARIGHMRCRRKANSAGAKQLAPLRAEAKREMHDGRGIA